MNYLYPVADIAKPSVDAGEMITSAKELGIHTSSTVFICFVLFAISAWGHVNSGISSTYGHIGFNFKVKCMHI